MFRLPVCPHCKTVFRYKDVCRIWGENIKNTYRTTDRDKAHRHTCYHCHKEFKASVFPGITVLLLIWLPLNVGTLLFMLSVMTDFHIVWLFIVTLIYMALVFLLIPFFMTFKKPENKKKQ